MSNTFPRSQIAIIGTGYVGLVTGAGLCSLGHTVNCVDIDTSKIESLKNGHVPFFEKDLSDLVVRGLSSGKLSFTDSLAQGIVDTPYIFICVPTPKHDEGGPDLSYLLQSVKEISNLLNKKTYVIVKSTIPVGIFDQIKLYLTQIGDRHIELVSCPEFLSEGKAVQDFFHPTRTVIGASSPETAAEIAGLFAGVSGKIILTTPNTAQLIKYSANAFLAVRVAFINEIASLCESLNVDVKNISDALLMDPRLGHGYLNAGVGFAGPCLPKDLNAIIHTAKQAGIETFLCSNTEIQNDKHLELVIQNILQDARPGDTVAVFGLAFKPMTDDVRNSFAVKIVKALTEYGLSVQATDPRAITAARNVLGDHERIRLLMDPFQAARNSHLQVFLTPWPGYSEIDLPRLRETVAKPAIFDAPGMFEISQVTQYGFSYRGVGRYFPDPSHVPFYQVI